MKLDYYLRMSSSENHRLPHVQKEGHGTPGSVARAWLSLEGLSLGDSFGECFFSPLVYASIDTRQLPEKPWFYTDDTMMAWSIVEELAAHGKIDQDSLAKLFAAKFRLQPNRGYGAAAVQLLDRIALGYEWRAAAAKLFNGEGSMGNGAAMRAAPIGAYFADALDRVVHEARASAVITHAHPEGQAGAIAIAVGAAVAWQNRDQSNVGEQLLEQAHTLTPDGATRAGIAKAIQIDPSTSVLDAAYGLGSGQKLLSRDTVPFALWCAARFANDYEEALWNTALGLGDVDTTCAMVGGIVSLVVGQDGLPKEWLLRREPLEE